MQERGPGEFTPHKKKNEATWVGSNSATPQAKLGVAFWAAQQKFLAGEVCRFKRQCKILQDSSKSALVTENSVE